MINHGMSYHVRLQNNQIMAYIMKKNNGLFKLDSREVQLNGCYNNIHFILLSFCVTIW